MVQAIPNDIPSWKDIVIETKTEGKTHPDTKKLYEIGWLKANFGDRNVPKIIGFDVYLTQDYIFGFQFVYSNGKKGTRFYGSHAPSHVRIEHHDLIGSEYITKVDARLGNWCD